MDDSDYLYVIRPTRPEMLSDGMTEAEQNTVAADAGYRGADLRVGRFHGCVRDRGAEVGR